MREKKKKKKKRSNRENEREKEIWRREKELIEKVVGIILYSINSIANVQ